MNTNTNTIENEMPIPVMTFERFCHIMQMQQRLTARTALTRADRKKTKLTQKELFNKWAQMGKRLVYKDISFTVKDGMGQLTIDNRGIWGATISDFYNAVLEKYNHRIKQLEE